MKFVEIVLHRRCTSVRFLIQHPRTLGRPLRTGVRSVGWSNPPARPRAVGRSVSRWYQISHAIQVRRFTWATAIEAVGSAKCVISVSIPRWCTWQHPRSTPAAYL